MMSEPPASRAGVLSHPLSGITMRIDLPRLALCAPTMRRSMQMLAIGIFTALLLATPDTMRADSPAAKPSLLEQLRGGGRIIACRHAATALARPASRTSERTLSAAGRAQARRLGEGIRGQRIPVGPVLAAPGQPTLESARASFGAAVRAAPVLEGSNDPALPRLFTGDVAAGSNRVLVASEAVLRRMLPHHGRAPLNEGDCLVLWPERGGPAHILARLAPDDWARLRNTPHP
jgi:hypothetical protein